MLTVALRRCGRIATLAAGAAVWLSAAAPPVMSDQSEPSVRESEIDRPMRPAVVTAYAGFTAWSRFDPHRRRYDLVVRDPGGVIRRLPVRSRRVAFDVDLGPGANGRVNAVYSRCRREPATATEPNPLPAWWEARGCKLFRVAVEGGVERRVGLPRGTSAYLPTLWRSRIAYARHPARRSAKTEVVMSDVDGGHRARL